MQPYAQSLPASHAEPTAASALPIASATQRVLTCLLDTVFFFVFAFVVGVCLALLGWEDVLDKLPDFALGILLMLLYYVPQEAAGGRTLGKRIMHTRAVRDDGSPMSIGQVLARSLARFIPFEALSVLGGDGKPRMWHDRVAKTVVISTRAG